MANLETDESASIPDIVKQELEELEKELAAETGDAAAPLPTDDVPDPDKPILPEQPITEPEPIPEPLIAVPDTPVPVKDDHVPDIENMGELGGPLSLNGKGSDPDPGHTEDGSEKDAHIGRLEQTVRTLKGKLDAEIPRLAEQLRESKEQVRELEIKRSNEWTPEKVKQMSDADLMKEFNVTEDEMLLGRETVELTVNRINDLKQELSETFLRTMEEQKFSLAQVQMRTELKELVPTWESVKDSDQFVEWLDKRPAEQQLYKAADDTLDANSASEVFKRYLGATGQTDAQRVSLASQIAPTPAANSAVNGKQHGPSAQKRVNEDWMLQEYNRVAHGLGRDGSKMTLNERAKEKAVLNEITRGTSKEYVLVS